LFDEATRGPKFQWGQPVSDHPFWRWQAAAGIALATAVFGIAMRAGRDGSSARWGAVAAMALTGGTMVGWAVELMLYESLGLGGWLRSAVMVALAGIAPLAASVLVMSGGRLPALADVLAGRSAVSLSRTQRIAGFLLAVTVAIAIQVALGLVFNPRYKDIPFAPLTAAIVPFVLAALFCRGRDTSSSLAERIAAGTLAVSAVYILFNESFANWQSVWFCALLAALAFSLVRFRWPRAARN
jgi:hypothetical protein